MKKDDLKQIRQIAFALPVMNGVNHYRKLKDAFKTNDIKGVTDYVAPYLEMRKKQIQRERTKKN